MDGSRFTTRGVPLYIVINREGVPWMGREDCSLFHNDCVMISLCETRDSFFSLPPSHAHNYCIVQCVISIPGIVRLEMNALHTVTDF